MNLLTIRPKQELIAVRRVIRWPEPVRDLRIKKHKRGSKSSYQKKSLRVSFFAPEIGINPDHDGPASKFTSQDKNCHGYSNTSNSDVHQALTIRDLRAIDEELLRLRVLELDRCGRRCCALLGHGAGECIWTQKVAEALEALLLDVDGGVHAGEVGARTRTGGDEGGEEREHCEREEVG